MVSAGVCFGGKERLHFVNEKAKVDTMHYVGHLLPKIVEDCNQLLLTGFTFQQDGAPAHTARSAQVWLQANCLDFIAKDQWPPNSPDLNPLDYHVWGMMLEAYHQLHPKPKSTGLKKVLQVIWVGLPQKPIDKAVYSFPKQLKNAWKLEVTILNTWSECKCLTYHSLWCLSAAVCMCFGANIFDCVKTTGLPM